jgi:hypothetical protein
MTTRRTISHRRTSRKTGVPKKWTRARLMKLAPETPREKERTGILDMIERHLTRPETPSDRHRKPRRGRA